MFDPADMQPLRNHKLNYLIYSITTQSLKELEKVTNTSRDSDISDTQNKIIKLNKIRTKLFEYLTKTFDARAYVSAIFVQKFERIDFDYLNFTNLMVDKAQAALIETKIKESTFDLSPTEQFEVVE